MDSDVFLAFQINVTSCGDLQVHQIYSNTSLKDVSFKIHLKNLSIHHEDKSKSK